MIKDINIKNYKSVVNQKLSLGQFNVVIGANGCGKSNLLEALALAGLSSSGALLPEMFESRGIRLADNRFMRSAFDEVDEEFIEIHVTTTDNDVSSYQIHDNTNKKPAQWEDVVEEETKDLLTTVVENGKNFKLNDLLSYLEEISRTKGEDRLLNLSIERRDETLKVSKSRVNGLKTFTIYSLEESALRSMDAMPSTEGAMSIYGIKNIPWRQDASSVATNVNPRHWYIWLTKVE